MHKINLLDVSIILPTYNEALNLPKIIPEIHTILKQNNLNGEIIVVDDNSPDHTYQIACDLAKKYPVKPILRTQDPGLSASVLDGFKASVATVCVVMDADGSHPIATLPQMIKPILAGQTDISVGSRNIVGGGSTHWPWYRQVISRVAASMSIGLSKMTDPTTGYMAVKRSMLASLDLNPIGWKIVLEVVVKAGKSARLHEVPITFNDRIYGQSKMNPKTQWHYIQHLIRLYTYKYQSLTEFIIFSFIGLVGMGIDMSVVICLKLLFNWDIRLLAFLGFLVAVTNNYYFNRYLNFNIIQIKNTLKTWAYFVLVCTFGLLFRLLTIHLLIISNTFDKDQQFILLNFIGIIVATFVNFIGSKFIVFKAKNN